MRIVFWLLDINEETIDGRAEAWLWGIDENGKRVLLMDAGFLPYFYLIIGKEFSSDSFVRRILSKKGELGHIHSIEAVNRRYFGKMVQAVKVVCDDPENVPVLAKGLSREKEVVTCLEQTIRFTMQYMIDKNVYPCTWYQMDVEEVPNDSHITVEHVYLCRSELEVVEKDGTPDLRVLAFNVVAYARKGTPRAEKDPIVVISTKTSKGEVVDFVAQDLQDRGIIEKFVASIGSLDPDVIVGFESNRRHWPYIVKRAAQDGVGLGVGRWDGQPHSSLYGHVSIMGRASIDILDFSDELQAVKVKTLDNVADFLGVSPLSPGTRFEETEIRDAWENERTRPLLLEQSGQDASVILSVAESMIKDAVGLSALTGIPLDQVGLASAGFRIEWVLMREAHRRGELIPTRREIPYVPYEGGIVLPPKLGVHEDVVSLDFKSMYPNIMMAKNLSPDTYVAPGDDSQAHEVTVAPEVGHRFRKEPEGFFKQVLAKLVSEREELQRKLEKLDKGTVEYITLDARQRAVKIITNATYGYSGWSGARWYSRPVAEAAAAWGRFMIGRTMEMARLLGLEIIYGDTDSIFVRNEPNKVRQLSERVRDELGLDIRPDKIYDAILFTEAKKRYCGLLQDGQLDIVGLEVVRGDWTNVAKDVQEAVLGALLRDKSTARAIELVRQYIADLRKRRVLYSDLVIWKALTKPVDQYSVNAAHISAARELLSEGWNLVVGDKVGYVITVGKGKLYERARPYVLASYDQIDIEYYVENQILPPALRVLEPFGIEKKSLLTE